MSPLLGREHGNWVAVHALYAECRCSRRIVAHLTTTSRPPGWQEIVLWVGNEPPSAELQRRFDVRRLSPAELRRLGIEAAPALIVTDPEGRTRYSGGYTDRKQGPVIDDLRILSETKQRPFVSEMPVFGCAVSEELRRAMAALPSF